ncbi:YlbF family regulator [Lactococcus nasutitermitis]|uniref:YlbF family regulator n=1 Tax=Lactococcus nasutitermitis TaxID=1652957 RepID=A0ABV9JIX0_9LACT|nr:YlbF family regulator [Lactococcus nasutitermitis]
MLIIDEKLLEIENSFDNLVTEIGKSSEVARYKKLRRAFLADEKLQKKIAQLNENRDFLAYRPELRELQKEIFMDEKVYQLRLAENDVQVILSNLTKKIASSISENIYVDENIPLKGGSRHDRHHRNEH